MAGFGDKTPVSCLQEYLVSKRMMPQYELIHNGVGTHMPEFTYRVQAGTHSEEGTGRSKQEAKHRAAEKMLKRLKVIDKNIDEEEAFESNLEVTENYVGQLKELCFLLHYPEPKYYLEETAGPSHSRVFKMICSVSQLKDFGIYKTKKQAKHQAAFKMIERLKEVGGNKIKEALHQSESLFKNSNKVSDEDITNKYLSMRTICTPSFKDPAAFYKDNHQAYLTLSEKSPTLTGILKSNEAVNLNNSISIIRLIAKELDVTLSTVKIPSKTGNPEGFIVLSMSVFPPIAAIGSDEKSAANNLLKSILALI